MAKGARIKCLLVRRRQSMSGKREPTAKQLEVLRAIRGWLDREGHYPTIRELMGYFGWTSPPRAGPPGKDPFICAGRRIWPPAHRGELQTRSGVTVSDALLRHDGGQEPNVLT